MQNPGLMSVMIEHVRFVNRKRWFRFAVRGRGRNEQSGFFDAHPRFFSTSKTAVTRDRLNGRYRALIESNADHIADKRVLDLTSHDGRWSLAASKAGARYVMGIEARAHLVAAARKTMIEYGIPTSRVEFTQGDLFVELDKLEARSFDTVFCFGFLYHTIDHMVLLRKIARIGPVAVIVDTAISPYPGCIIEVDREDIEDEAAGAIGEVGDSRHVLIGKPNKSALELMLRAAGYPKLRYYDWMNAEIRCWDYLKDYYLRERITLTAEANR